MNLSEIAKLDSFALLSPGFGNGHFILCEELQPSNKTGNIVIQPFEGEPQWYNSFAGEIDLDMDVPPQKVNYSADDKGYCEGVETIRSNIASGNVYQVNLTMRATISEISGAELFASLCKNAVPRFAAWVKLPDGNEIVSASPEMFFERNNSTLHCQPMKGTAPKDAKDWLVNSEKDASELAMITDLIRNDMTPLCQQRSVKVINERKFIELPYVVQAVSDVEGILLPEVTVSDILKGLHPCGSITGAPKQAAIQLIKQLENTPRKYYCGSLGYINDDKAIFSILIRTAYRSGKEWIYGAGGGIVWDSEPALELEEARMKMGILK